MVLIKYKITWTDTIKVQKDTVKEIQADPSEIAEISKLSGFTYQIIP